MIKITDSVREIVDHNPSLQLGLAQRLTNLSQLARHIHAAVEARSKKSVKVTAITMALSRLQSELPDPGDREPLRLADRLTVQRGLTIITFLNTPKCHEGLPDVQQRIRTSDGYLTITEGIREITLICEARKLDLVKEIVGEPPLKVLGDIASISVSLTAENVASPGVLYRLLQPLALQGLALAEVASTTSEFHVYLSDRDVMLALDALYATFSESEHPF